MEITSRNEELFPYINNLLTHQPKEYLFLDQKRKIAAAKRIMKNIVKFDLKPDDIGFGNSLIPNYNF